MSWQGAGAAAGVAISRSAFATAVSLKPVGRVADLNSAAGVGAVDGTVALLHHVGQLMRDHVLARIGGGVVLVALEHDVGPDGVGLRVDRLRRIMRGAVVVDANVAEVRTEPALHVGTEVPGQRRATGGDHVVDRRALLVDDSRAVPALPTARCSPMTPAGPAASSLPDKAAFSASADSGSSTREAFGRKSDWYPWSLSCARMVASLPSLPNLRSNVRPPDGRCARVSLWAATPARTGGNLRSVLVACPKVQPSVPARQSRRSSRRTAEEAHDHASPSQPPRRHNADVSVAGCLCRRD